MVEQREGDSREIRRFSSETREALEKEGYTIYELTGQSIASQMQAGRNFQIENLADFPIRTQQSMRSEVAIKLGQLFIQGSDRKTLEMQKSLILDFSRNLSSRTEEVEAVMGSSADYIDLAFAHLDRTTQEGHPDYLFAANLHCVRTTTVSEGLGITIGQYGTLLTINTEHPEAETYGTYAVPLVIPRSLSSSPVPAILS